MTTDTTALMGLLRTVLERLDSIDSRLNGNEYQMPRLLTPKDVERRFQDVVHGQLMTSCTLTHWF